MIIRSVLNSKVTLEHMTTTPCCTMWLNVDKTLKIDAQHDSWWQVTYRQ